MLARFTFICDSLFALTAWLCFDDLLVCSIWGSCEPGNRVTVMKGSLAYWLAQLYEVIGLDQHALLAHIILSRFAFIYVTLLAQTALVRFDGLLRLLYSVLK